MSMLPASRTPALAAALAAASEPPSAWPDRLVDAVVAILTREAAPGYRVDWMPDKPADYDMSSWDGAILVHYEGSKYRAAPAATPIAPQRVFDFVVHILARGVSGRDGAPSVMEAVRLSLQNRQVEGSTPLAPIEDGFAAETGGVWTYSIRFRGELPAVGRAYPHPSRLGASP